MKRSVSGRASVALSGVVCVLLLGAIGCRSDKPDVTTRSQPPVPPEPPSVQKSARLAPPPRSSAAPRAAPGDPLSVATLKSIEVKADGTTIAELAGVPNKVHVVLATHAAPRAHLAPYVHHQVARLLAPDLVRHAVLRQLGLDELSAAARDTGTRARLRVSPRVLGDGKVRALLVELPKSVGEPIDIGNLTQGPPERWDRLLSAREPVPGDLAGTLADYLSLLMVDYLVSNLERREVQRDAASGRLSALVGNGAFSGQGVDGAVSDAIQRLARSACFSRRTVQRLRGLERAQLDSALRDPWQRQLLVTPHQLDEILEHRGAILRLVDARIRLRGEANALSLP